MSGHDVHNEGALALKTGMTLEDLQAGISPS
jgi:hypothetical protein